MGTGRWPPPGPARDGRGRPRPGAELLGVELATIPKAAAKVEQYVRADGTMVWSLM